MTAIEQTLEEHGPRYGCFLDHATICQSLKEVMQGVAGWERLQADQKQALEVIADKIARILNGDPDYLDNWHDIQGYAKLVEDRLGELQLARIATLSQSLHSSTHDHHDIEAMQSDEIERLSERVKELEAALARERIK